MSTITHEQERTEEQRTYDDEVLERVKHGMAWLEKTHGPGWEDKIDLKTLQLSDGAQCVLGQVYAVEAREKGLSEGYLYGIQLMKTQMVKTLGGDPSADLGFDRRYREASYRPLQACWVDVLTPRVKKEE